MEGSHLRRRSRVLLALTSLLAGLVLFCWLSLPEPVITGPDLSRLPALQTGDWLFRLGHSADSRLVQQMGGGDYSHIGMVVATEPRVLVVHATTDDDPQRLNQVLVSTLEDFLQPVLARHFAVARPGFLNARQKQAAAQMLVEAIGAPFVLEVRSEPHRYCTTLLADAIKAQDPGFEPAWTRLDNPLYRGDVLFPSAFADYPGVTWLYRF
ncbi:YiiX/YebB-like N1pC/P60 family cysteine hydrolase [Pseudomonas argentinensis]|uniref:YiiX/YebB-like N1pC/P60 family cysteine hydrolase n=1 Tax=Phytopseudomonas argentinensis TaxID=289370 RepID=UPI001F44A38E|nr:YiiX/YebB-like N1pC/P60 family cysteine hydrolase [Pseudomonas argentinensis]